MSRTKKLERIELYHPGLYSKLYKQVPELIKSPEDATPQDIKIYNDLINDYAQKQNLIVWAKRFSF